MSASTGARSRSSRVALSPLLRFEPADATPSSDFRGCFTGMRIGEPGGDLVRLVAGREAVGSLRVHTQYHDQPVKTAKSGDATERMMPGKGRASRRSTTVLRSRTTS